VLEEDFGQPGNPETAVGIMKNNVTKRAYQKRYMDYWNSTANLTGTGRPVDAFIMAVAPFSAARPGK
jgi:amidase